MRKPIFIQIEILIIKAQTNLFLCYKHLFKVNDVPHYKFSVSKDITIDFIFLI